MMIRLSDTSLPEVKKALEWIQEQTFPADAPLDVNRGWWWIARDGEIPAAFAAMTVVTSWENTVYMARCGVLTKYRGQGLQRKMLERREKYAKGLGYERAITTTLNNPKSANNLIARGFITYSPQLKWGCADTIYWFKQLK